ncbi:LA2681 family HEPN domain-containing protein [Nocardia farcinica]|uniref:LA2681 family HEPN domain-containing protein n=1 Tax=Nocardia farcinica TaxID=37329 RepID=UPI0024543AB2|nr:LA2681 family HEPN domain-containing protein [Nocardia farcinica]
MDQETLRTTEGVIVFLAGKVDEDAERVLAMVDVLVADTFGESPRPLDVEEAATLMNAAGVLINAAGRASSPEGLRTGEEWMVTVVDSGLLAGSQFESSALYNLANSRIAIADLNAERAMRYAEEGHQIRANVDSRFADREALRRARSDLAAGVSLATDSRQRGMLLCNLANTLDNSGRWVEAYDAYARALEADPENGNAAGNAALLIERVIAAGWDFEGHLCTLYDYYLSHAKANRAGTVAVAGEGAARRFDQMKLLGTDQPVVARRDSEDPYRAWVIRHRLALVAALEGLGSNRHEGRWDTISLPSVTDSSDQTSPPVIFAILNVLKADYLVARRLAFEAEQMIEETGGWAQHRDDPGVYTETLDYAVYGEISSKLVLAHRAALDVLDKTAVAVNEHLQMGDSPRAVSFRKFWFEGKDGAALRSGLMRYEGLVTAVLSMSELAADMAKDSLYGHAQDVRNAGTHRFVLVHQGMTDVESTVTMQAITLDAMRESCRQSLTVARAAFLYLVSLLEMFEARSSEDSDLAIPLFLPDVL